MSATALRRLLLIHTGGTLMMNGGEPQPLVPDVYTRDLLDELPVLGRLAKIETKILFNLDSSDMQPHHWVTLARMVHAALWPGEGIAGYDGVVIVHGTDTMAYSASALAFLLPGLDRPVVFTGSQRPLSEGRTDARTNLVDACTMATTDIPEVAIVFGAQMLRGCRASKLDAWGMQAFGSPGCAALATLGLGLARGPHVLPNRAFQPFDDRLEPRVLAVRTFPGLDPRLLLGALTSGVRGLLIEAFGAGNVPRIENSLIPVIEAARVLDVPVVITSQCARGTVDLARYEGGVAGARAGAISGDDMTSEAALAKLMIALGRAGPVGRVRAVREAFAIRWAGETG